MCLSNSDVEVQSAGYTSAQSPTNWESIHGKDLSSLRRPSSRLSIALDDKNTKCDIQDCGLTEQTCTNFLMTNFLIFYRNFVINTITICLGPRPMQNGLKYGMFQTDFDVCANFSCVRWCHHKTVLYLAHIHCRNVQYTNIHMYDYVYIYVSIWGKPPSFKISWLVKCPNHPPNRS